MILIILTTDAFLYGDSSCRGGLIVTAFSVRIQDKNKCFYTPLFNVWHKHLIFYRHLVIPGGQAKLCQVEWWCWLCGKNKLWILWIGDNFTQLPFLRCLMFDHTLISCKVITEKHAGWVWNRAQLDTYWELLIKDEKWQWMPFVWCKRDKARDNDRRWGMTLPHYHYCLQNVLQISLNVQN